MLKQTDPMQHDPDAPIGDLIGRIVNDGRELAEAEVELIKAKAVSNAMQYKASAILFAVAALFGLAAVVTLCMTVALSLAPLIGPLLGGLVATLLALSIAGIAALLGKKKLERSK